MIVKIAENAGFCFGVKRAVDGIQKVAEEKRGRIYTLGELIHNNTVLEELAEKGIKIAEVSELPEIIASASEKSPVTVAIRAHGTEKQTEDILYGAAKENPYFTVVDLTCPYVKKIHKTVTDNPDRKLVVFGDPNHPEVRGIVSRGASGYIVISSPEEAEALETDDTPVVIVSQTTQNVRKWEKTQKIFEKVFTNRLIFDTICRVTDDRQKSTEALSTEVDCMLVIGSRQSSNTGKLYEISKRNLDSTYFIESPEDLPTEIINKFRKVGITAGASTPERLIQEVYRHMSENINFAELLEESFKTIHNGDIVSGTVSAVTDKELYVDIGAKTTGIIKAEDATNDPSTKLTDLFKVGDEIEASVIKVNEVEGVAALSKKRVDSRLQWKKVADAAESKEIIEGIVLEAVKGGVIIGYEGSKIFIPASQSGVAKDGDLNTLVGQTKRFIIIDTDEGKKRAVGSIRKVENEEKKAKAQEFWSTVEIGKFYEGEVKSITSYGAFVDLGGVDGMVHSSELSWSHIKSPADVVSVGDVVRVFVKDVDLEKKRISLGYKTPETNPWNVFKANYTLNDVVMVKIASLTSFGAFAEILPGVDGLIHISQIADRKIGAPSEVLSVGQEVKVEIVSINDEKQQIGLSIRTLLEKEKEGDEVVEEAAEVAEEATEA